MPDVQQLVNALEGGDMPTIRTILQQAPSLAQAHARDGWSMLHLAPTAEVAERLLDAGADIEAANRHKVLGPGNKPLHSAVYNRRRDVIDALLSRGANVNSTDNAGWTPLHIAVSNSQIELAHLLLNAGANPNARLAEVPGQDWSAQTPIGLLSVANRTGEGVGQHDPVVDEEMQGLLVSYGALA